VVRRGRAASCQKWLRGLDSNQDNQLQRLACYQLHYPGITDSLTVTVSRCNNQDQNRSTGFLSISVHATPQFAAPSAIC
jgi:hypothetical protein